MSVAVIGSGRLATSVQRHLSHQGVTARLHSRATGFDVFDRSTHHEIGDVDVVIEATDIQTQQERVARGFFVRSTRAANTVAARAKAKHILISIVNVNQPKLQGNGYYAGKAAQERVALSEHSRLTVVRSTTWHEFAHQNLERFRIGPLSLVPSMLIRPIALNALAQAVTECAIGDRSGVSYDFAGPEVTTLWGMTKHLGRNRTLIAPLRVPGAAGKAMRHGVLLPNGEYEVVGPSFNDWLTSDRCARSRGSIPPGRLHR
ncbi:MAG: hypothetical protein ACTH2U_12125 [Brevibacterium sp.]